MRITVYKIKFTVLGKWSSAFPLPNHLPRVGADVAKNFESGDPLYQLMYAQVSGHAHFDIIIYDHAHPPLVPFKAMVTHERYGLWSTSSSDVHYLKLRWISKYNNRVMHLALAGIPTSIYDKMQ